MRVGVVRGTAQRRVCGWLRASWNTPQTAIDAGDDEHADRPERRLRRLAEHDDADRDGDERVDDGESGDHEVGRAGRVGVLHEVRAERGRERAAPSRQSQREPLDTRPARSVPSTTFARVATKP